METERGITEYLHQGKGCGGIIKMRYSDFLVNEVNINGDRVHFDSKCWNTSVKEHEDFLSNKEKIKNDKAENKKNEEPVQIEEEIERVKSSLPEDRSPFSKKQIDTLVKMQVDKTCNKPLNLEVEGMNKLERTAIHEFVKNLDKLDSETKKDGQKSIIQIKRRKGGVKRRGDRRGGEERLIYKFVLYKENIGTMDAISLLCKKLRLNNLKGFNYAGTKDKRGITTQEITSMLGPQRLMRINNMVNNIRVGNFRPTDSHLRLGDLSGNHFTIVLRNVNTEGCNLDEACKSLVDNGFINYFGMQRFGTGAVATHRIGMAIINSQWKDAIESILSNSYTSEETEVQEKLKNWQVEGNAAACVDLLGKKANIERQLLRGLIKFGTKQLCQALNGIVRNTRLLYLHSYQSYVWNRMVSKRIKQFGLKVVEGDLVSLDSIDNDSDKPSVEDSEEPNAKKAKVSTTEDREEEEGWKITRVKRVSADDIDKYSISQVVLPLPGCDVIYPKYDDKCCWYKQMIEEVDGVEMKDFNHGVKTYYLSGAYRFMLGFAKNLKYEVIKYDNYMLPLMLNDKEKMMKKPQPPIVEDGKYEALKIEFQLSTSTYATVALREITKTDLGPMYQIEAEKTHKLTQQQ